MILKGIKVGEVRRMNIDERNKGMVIVKKRVKEKKKIKS